MSSFKHSSRKVRTIVATVATAGAALLSGVAMAAPPASIGNTTWSILIDQTYATLTISNQGGPGAPGAALCRVILGSLGIAPVSGYYCPTTGRIHFLHKNVATGATVRDFTGVVTAATPQSPTQMAGTFNVMNAAFGSLGEYPFSAVQ